jgi:7,8-dihydro-6-hydroxymethylpterin-pyrophosphokinase
LRTAVALGSNLGDRLSNLHAARKVIVDLSGVISPMLSSAIYETDPVGCEPGAGKFLNAVLEFDYEGDPLELLKSLREIEKTLGRAPDHPRNISRRSTSTSSILETSSWIAMNCSCRIRECICADLCFNRLPTFGRT